MRTPIASIPMLLSIALVALLVGGCAEKKAPAETGAEKAAVTAEAPATTPEKAAETKAGEAKNAAAPEKAVEAAPPKTVKPTRAQRKARSAIEWPEGVQWVASWEEARNVSAESGKPICLVVYADWCPRCKELAPMFADTAVIEASKGLVMVLQDHDARPDWLQAYADQGSYVPRIFFFGADGNLRTDVTSGHARFPYFYSARGKKALLRSMTTVTGG